VYIDREGRPAPPIQDPESIGSAGVLHPPLHLRTGRVQLAWLGVAVPRPRCQVMPGDATPVSYAIITNWARSRASSFINKRLTWVLTVAWLT